MRARAAQASWEASSGAKATLVPEPDGEHEDAAQEHPGDLGPGEAAGREQGAHARNTNVVTRATATPPTFGVGAWWIGRVPSG